MSLTRKIESLLFVASRPISLRKISELLGVSIDETKSAVESLKQSFNTEDRGIQIATHAASVQMVTNPMTAKVVADFLKEERSGELTRPSLETLTIIAYRGPIAKAEIDLVRGVNCTLILRNLMVRGLVTSREDKDAMTTVYEITFDFLRHLGVRDVTELPDYQQLSQDVRLNQFLHPETVPPAEPASEPATEGQIETEDENHDKT